MKHALAIATTNRRSLVEANIARLARQTVYPDLIVVCVPDDQPSGTHAPEYSGAGIGQSSFDAAAGPLDIVTIRASRGLAAQRNGILKFLIERNFDLVTFIDDDFLAADNYVAIVRTEFAAHPDYAVIRGSVPYDGVRSSGFTLEQGETLLAQAFRNLPASGTVIDHPGAYGCNMSIRLRQVGDLRFDERLPLYGWQEDIDFTSQLGKFGRIVELTWLIGVHLGHNTGRQPGLRLGYSQIANPLYLIRKGTMPTTFGLGLMTRNVMANIMRSMSPEPHIDRRGRLRGNIIALTHALAGRIEPEHILKL